MYPTSIILAINGVLVARDAPILSQDGATASRNIFKYLPGSPEVIVGLTIAKIVQRPKNIICLLKILSDPSLLSADAGIKVYDEATCSRLDCI